MPYAGKEQKEDRTVVEGMVGEVCFLGLSILAKLIRVIHSLDLMHITKNVCESLLATILNMP